MMSELISESTSRLITEPIQLAHSSGAGSGRFLQRALVDSLQVHQLADVLGVRKKGCRVVEFVFTGEMRRALEVISCRLTADDVPDLVAVWLQRDPGELMLAHRDQKPLKEWLPHTVQICGLSLEQQGLQVRGEVDAVTIQCRRALVSTVADC